MSPPERPSDRIVIAVVTRPHGLRGEVRAKVFNDDTEVLRSGAKVSVGRPGEKPRSLRIASVQPHKDTWVVGFAESTTPEHAEALRGAEISVRRDELPAAGDGEFYHHDLVGCAVVDADGKPFGTVRDVASYPSVDALVIPREKGEIEVPFVDGIVLGVDLATRTIRIDPSALEEEDG